MEPYGKQPYTGQPSAKEITGGTWPARARTARDNPDKVIRIYDREYMRAAIVAGADPERAMHAAECATLYIRHTGLTCYVVGLFSGIPDAEGNHPGTRVFYGSANGGGYDKEAAAADGMLIADGIILTDHCGLDRFDPSTLPASLQGMRSVVVSSSREMPTHLFLR